MSLGVARTLINNKIKISGNEGSSTSNIRHGINNIAFEYRQTK